MYLATWNPELCRLEFAADDDKNAKLHVSEPAMR